LAVTGTGSVNVAGEKLIILFATDRYTIKKNFHFYTTTSQYKIVHTHITSVQPLPCNLDVLSS